MNVERLKKEATFHIKDVKRVAVSVPEGSFGPAFTLKFIFIFIPVYIYTCLSPSAIIRLHVKARPRAAEASGSVPFVLYKCKGGGEARRGEAMAIVSVCATRLDGVWFVRCGSSVFVKGCDRRVAAVERRARWL